ncbi:hypothetical protein ACR30T_00195 [Neisseria gonorrhoeae]
MNVNQLTQETIELMKSAQAGGGPPDKGFTQPGFTACKPMTFPRRLKNSTRY